jgi:hypothetical protein
MGKKPIVGISMKITIEEGDRKACRVSLVRFMRDPAHE